MSMTMIFRLLLIVLAVSGCGSAAFVQSNDVCNIKRHHADDVYQVTINDEVISKQYFLKEDAILIAQDLASSKLNKCAPREFSE